jgi:hypothetical protein
MINDEAVVVTGHIEALRALERPEQADEVTPVDERGHPLGTSIIAGDLELDSDGSSGHNDESRPRLTQLSQEPMLSGSASASARPRQL